MSDRTDSHPAGDDLRDFLRNKGENEDEFARDAREGFGRISEDNAMRLKSRLDKRVNARLTNRQRGPVIYWVAAAAVLLLIGFSVMFVREAPPQPQSLSYEDRREKVVTDPIRTPKPEDVLAEEKSVQQDQNPDPVSIATGKKSVRETGNPAAMDVSPKPSAAPSEPEVKPQVAAENAVLEKTADASFLARSDAEPEPVSAPPAAAEKSESGKRKPVSARAALTQGAANAAPVIQATYPGGSDSLCGQLREKLASSVARFSAVIRIDRDGKVKKADVTTDYKITPSETHRIERTIGSISGFSLNADPGSATVEYRFGCMF